MPIELTNRFGLLSLYMLQRWFEYPWGEFCLFRRVTSLNFQKLNNIKNCFANKDFLNTVLDTIKQVLSKSSCQRN